MSASISNHSGVKLGVVPTHCKFIGGLVPDDQGKLPRHPDGALVLLSEARTIVERSPVKPEVFQISVFPGTAPDDQKELFDGLKALDLEIQIVLMVGGVNPLAPADEDSTVEQLVAGLTVAQEYGVTTVSSTSFEEWMSGRPELTGTNYDAAVAQLVNVHVRAYQEAKVADSCIEFWNLEFLRTGEFTTFTSIAKAAPVVTAINEALGQKVMQMLIDAAHCGDSGIDLLENQKLIKDVAARGELGIFHASAKTTRGCLSTDDGWIASLLTTCAATGQLHYVFIELFHHEDEALAGLRNLDPGHGIDTTDGRSYTDTIIDGLTNLVRRLNNLKIRGILSQPNSRS